MDISFYTLANALGITCAAAAFLIFLRRTARGQEENDATAEQPETRARQEKTRDASVNDDKTPGNAADAPHDDSTGTQP